MRGTGLARLIELGVSERSGVTEVFLCLAHRCHSGLARYSACGLDRLCGRKGWAWEAGYSNSLVAWRPSMAAKPFELS